MRLNRRRNSSNCDSPQNVSLSIRKIGWHFSLSLSLTPLNRRAELKLSNYQHPEWRETILLALHSIICGLTFVHFSCVLCFITIPHSIANLRAKAICHRLDVCVCVCLIRIRQFSIHFDAEQQQPIVTIYRNIRLAQGNPIPISTNKTEEAE